jgi:hypothetical protein
MYSDELRSRDRLSRASDALSSRYSGMQNLDMYFHNVLRSASCELPVFNSDEAKQCSRTRMAGHFVNRGRGNYSYPTPWYSRRRSVRVLTSCSDEMSIAQRKFAESLNYYDIKSWKFRPSHSGVQMQTSHLQRVALYWGPEEVANRTKSGHENGNDLMATVFPRQTYYALHPRRSRIIPATRSAPDSSDHQISHPT